jgi:hypothetical protein
LSFRADMRWVGLLAAALVLGATAGVCAPVTSSAAGSSAAVFALGDAAWPRPWAALDGAPAALGPFGVPPITAQLNPPPPTPPADVPDQGIPSSPDPTYQRPKPGLPAAIGGDRPRRATDALFGTDVNPALGVEVAVGAPQVTLSSKQLHINQGEQSLFSDGAVLSVDYVRNAWRLEYVKLLLRRQLASSTVYAGQAVNFAGIDIDQFWGYYGVWPVYNLFIGGGAGVEYRLTRLSETGTNVKAVTDTLGVWGLLVNWAVTPPFTLKFLLYQEDAGGIDHVEGATFQIGCVVSF